MNAIRPGTLLIILGLLGTPTDSLAQATDPDVKIEAEVRAVELSAKVDPVLQEIRAIGSELPGRACAKCGHQPQVRFTGRYAEVYWPAHAAQVAVTHIERDERKLMEILRRFPQLQQHLARVRQHAEKKTVTKESK